MFDRCDADTRSIVDAALDESRRRGHNWLGNEHVLLALAQRRDLLPPEVAAAPPGRGTVATALDAELDGPPGRDAQLLGAVGIELESVRSAVRRTFAERALEKLGRRRVHQPWQPWRRPTRRCMSILAGSMSLTPRLKQAFEHARRDAERRSSGSPFGSGEAEGASAIGRNGFGRGGVGRGMAREHPITTTRVALRTDADVTDGSSRP